MIRTKDVGPEDCGDMVPCCQGDDSEEACTKDCSCWFAPLTKAGLRVVRIGDVVQLNFNGLTYLGGSIYIGQPSKLTELSVVLSDITRGLSGFPDGYMQTSMVIELSLPSSRVRMYDDEVPDLVTPEGWEWLRERLGVAKPA